MEVRRQDGARMANGSVRARPISAIIEGASSAEASRLRGRADTMEYRPTRTGEILPQWKLDLMERRKAAATHGQQRRESIGGFTS